MNTTERDNRFIPMQRCEIDGCLCNDRSGRELDDSEFTTHAEALAYAHAWCLPTYTAYVVELPGASA